LILIQLTAFLPRKYLSRERKPLDILKLLAGKYNNNGDNKKSPLAMMAIRGDEKNSALNRIESMKLSDKIKEQYEILEYPLIILFIVTGAMFLISSGDIMSIFLSIELQSYGLYLICALYRNSELSTGASLTYFLLGGLSSCFILLALGILYANSGATNLDGYYIFTNLSDTKHNMYNFTHWYNNDYINYSLVIMSIGFLFKISAAPFHFWSPDVYDAIPTIVTAFVANIAKISILILLVGIANKTSNLIISNFNWTNCLLLSSLLSLVIGTVLGLNQSRIKRLLAYSTISHLGFMLLAMSINSIESIQAFIFYLMQYSITNINSFIIIITIGYTMYMYKKEIKEENIMLDENNSPIQYISQFKGYFYINPLIAISLTVVMFSFVGIPPLVGFFAKQMVLASALDKGYIFISLIAIITSVISAVYYLNVVKEIFFSKSDYVIINEKSRYYNMGLSSNLTTTISTLTLVISLFMLSCQEWLSISNILGLTTFN
jgi:NADH-ubiquinone oxidoreductase chain 2